MQLIIEGEGDVKWVEDECKRTWLEERSLKEVKEDEETGARSSIGFDYEAFQVAKRLFLESDLCEDLNHLNSLANRSTGQKKRYGLTLNKKKDFVNQFLALERDAKGNVKTAIDAVEVKALGVHRALVEGNTDMYRALQANQLKDAQILDYLEGCVNSQSDSSS